MPAAALRPCAEECKQASANQPLAAWHAACVQLAKCACQQLWYCTDVVMPVLDNVPGPATLAWSAYCTDSLNKVLSSAKPPLPAAPALPSPSSSSSVASSSSNKPCSTCEGLPGLRCLPCAFGLLLLCLPAAAPPLLCSPVPAVDSSSLIAALLRLLRRSWTCSSHSSSRDVTGKQTAGTQFGQTTPQSQLQLSAHQQAVKRCSKHMACMHASQA